MPPKCKVRKTWPAIGPKGCKAKPEEPWPGYVNDMRRHKLNKKVAELNDLVTHTEQITRVVQLERQAKENAKKAVAVLKRNNLRVALELEENLKALSMNEKLNKAVTKTNAAATRASIIRRIKAARGRKHMAVH
jgi:hypothetical protein